MEEEEEDDEGKVVVEEEKEEDNEEDKAVVLELSGLLFDRAERTKRLFLAVFSSSLAIH